MLNRKTRLIVAVTSLMCSLALSANVNVTIDCSASSSDCVPQQAIFVNDATKYEFPLNDSESSSTKISVEHGIYDCIIIFNKPSLLGGVESSSIIVKEEIDCTNDITLLVDAAKATNHIAIKTYYADGEEMRVPKLYVDINDHQAEPEILEEGNTTHIEVYSFLSIDGIGVVWDSNTAITRYVTTDLGDIDPYLQNDFFINDVSDRFMIEQLRVPYRDNTDRQAIAYVLTKGMTDDVEIMNDWENYLDLDCNFAKSPHDNPTSAPYGVRFVAIRENSQSPHQYGLGGKNKWSHLSISHAKGYDESENPTFAFQFAYDAYDDSSLPMPCTNLTQWIYPFSDNNGKSVAFPVGITAIHPGGSDNPVNQLPGYLPYSYQLNTARVEYCASAPLLNIIWGERFDQWDEIYRPFYQICPLGRLGEQRTSDIGSMTGFLKLENETIDIANLSRWCATLEQAPKGKAILSLTDNNFETNGIEAATSVEIGLDFDSKDHFPPTPTMLQTIDNKGAITPYFENNIDGLLKLSVADMNCVEGDDTKSFWFIADMPSLVTVEYRAHGNETFHQLQYEEINDFFTSYGFGSLYNIPLNQITTESESKWYDIRIFTTDKAGNYHTQIIECAFHINNIVESSVSNPERDQYLDEICDIYNMNGVLLYHGKYASARCSLPSGFYIIRMDSHTDKIAIY